MKIQPLITITIPTYNSEKFIPLSLEAIKNQTYENIEVIIVDGNSKDKTVKIAKQLGADKVINYTGALLGARGMGVKHAQGEYILLLDSDQILENSAVERAVYEMKSHDALIFEESVYECKTFIEYLFKLDRLLVHRIKDFSPYTGVMLPRFYSKTILERAFNKIPIEQQKEIGGQDHAIIYFEVWKITQKIGFLQNAVAHIEPSNLSTMWKKFYRWGYTSIHAHYGKYNELLKQKERFRKGLFQKGHIIESIASIILLIIKGVPYKTGYYKAKFDVWNKK